MLNRQEQARLLIKGMNTFGVAKGLQIATQLLVQRGETAEISLPNYKHPIQVRHGTSDVPTFEQIFVSKEYASFVEEANVIIDLGANVGYASIFFAETYPNAQIVAVEPEASNFEILLQNTHRYSNILPVQAAVWSHSKAPLAIKNPTDENWLFQVGEDEQGAADAIEAVTVAELLAMIDNPPTIDILKIDIESAEKELFSANYDAWLSKVKLLVIELHDQLLPDCTRTVYRALDGYSYQQFIIGENIFIVMN
ncbi:MAG: FkbM family methyltransferase [Chloroflexota bacterium]